MDQNQQPLPQFFVSYVMDNNVNTIEIPPYYYSWSVTNENGISIDRTGENFSHPLDNISNLPTIVLSPNQNILRLSFSQVPISYGVQYWNRSLYNNSNYKLERNFLQVYDNLISLAGLPEDNYVIQINSLWPQGNINYVFHVSYF